LFILSALLTYAVLHWARRRGQLDIPNDRSSHTQPTPRGGGLAIVLISFIGWVLLYAAGELDAALLLALLPGGMAIAAVGFVDDRRSVLPIVRFAVHAVSAAVAVYILQGLGPIQWGGEAVSLGVAGALLAVIGIVWSINLFNFMDGIDGLAGGQAAFMGGASTALVFLADNPVQVSGASVILAAASLGFLVFNWSPARIFMGDVGSGFVGFVIAVLAVAAVRTDPLALWVWVVLGALFIADATVTLLRRLARREPLHHAHRSHAYQHLSRRWGHQRVALAFLAANVLVVLPVAYWVGSVPAVGSWIALGFLGLLCLAFFALGSGRRE
jgi:Fuc2NAc and GlcNAc transferase